ncbi:hypothetical protein THIOSC15_1310002 [uncultured Thiomicrorhabdus sp.]
MRISEFFLTENDELIRGAIDACPVDALGLVEV